LLALYRSFTNEDTSDIPTPDGKPYSSMPEITVSIEGVQKLFQKLNPQKACGPDQIPARILRDLADVIAAPLTLIFLNPCWQSVKIW
jgi:hypothetical protein